MNKILESARSSFLQLQSLTSQQRNQALERLSQLILESQNDWLKSNAKDVEQGKELEDALLQRLHLTKEKIEVVAQGVNDVAQLPEVLGKATLHRELAPGLVLKRQNVPIGVIAIIFESRPDVLPQILALVLKTANAVVLKGGKETQNSNSAFMQIVERLNAEFSFLPKSWAQVVSTREDIHELLKRNDLVDLVIPRGSNQLVQFVMDSTKIPVLGHADGVCHIYAHSDCNPTACIDLILDAKLQYPSACNALETLLVHKEVAAKLIPALSASIEKAGGKIFGCPDSQKIASSISAVQNWHIEHGNNNLSVRVVQNLDEAIEHINTHGSKHTDCILTQDQDAIQRFFQKVDAAGVYANASTRFADGFRYGFGAEVGVSTSKTHARGPVGLEGLVTYKYTLIGENHCVSDFSGPDAKTYTHKDFS